MILLFLRLFVFIYIRISIDKQKQMDKIWRKDPVEGEGHLDEILSADSILWLLVDLMC